MPREQPKKLQQQNNNNKRQKTKKKKKANIGVFPDGLAVKDLVLSLLWLGNFHMQSWACPSPQKKRKKKISHRMKSELKEVYLLTYLLI